MVGTKSGSALQLLRFSIVDAPANPGYSNSGIATIAGVPPVSGSLVFTLAPGTYSITIAYCVSAERGLLVSNTILLEVEGTRTGKEDRVTSKSPPNRSLKRSGFSVSLIRQDLNA